MPEIDLASFKRIARQIIRLEAIPRLNPDESDLGTDPQDAPSILMKIVGAVAGGKVALKFVELWSDGTVTDLPDATGSITITPPTLAGVVQGKGKILTRALNYGGTGAAPIFIAEVQGFFPVLLALDPATPDPGSGTANAFSGNSTTAPSFKYTVMSLDGVDIIQGIGALTGCVTTTVLPKWRPQNLGKHLSGDGKIGMAYFAADGSLGLYSASEQIDAASC